MGALTLTPQYTDYGANTWASNPNFAAWQAVITQAFLDLGNGLSCPSGNHSFKIDFGYGAVGPAGDAVSSGAASNPNANGTPSYTSYRNALLAISGPNSVQSVAWNSSNLPVSNPVTDTTFDCVEAYGSAINLIFTSVPDGTVVAYVGISTSSYTDFDIHGMGAGSNLYQAVIHETTEMLGRRKNSELWWFNGVGSRPADGTTAHYLSGNGGNTNIYNLDTGVDQFDVISAQTSFSATKVTGPVSRSNTIPLFANDWIYMTILGWGLTSLGMQWAGLSATGPVGLIGLRR